MGEAQIGYYLVACFVSWYLLAGATYALNSGQLGRGRYLFPFQCFAEDIKCHWIGGQEHRIEFIKSRCYGEGTFCTSKRSYSHQEVRDNNLYEEVFWEMRGSRTFFWSQHFLYFFLGPILLVSILVIGNIIGLIVCLVTEPKY